MSIYAAVGSAGLQTVEPGGLASRTQVTSGGDLLVYSGGVASGVVVSAGGSATLTITLSKGQTLRTSGAYVPLAATVGVAGVTLSSGAYLTVLDPVIDSGGILIQGAAAEVTGVTVSSGGRLSGGVLYGGEEYYTFANTDAGLVSGIVLSQTFDEGGELQVLSGGVADAVQVGTNDELDVQSGGAASGALVSGVYSLLEVESGGYARAAVIGGSVTTGGQSAAIFGSSLIDVVEDGGFEAVGSGGVADRTSVSSGGVQTVSSGGEAVDTVVLSGGAFLLASGGLASQVSVSSGGVAVLPLDVASGAAFDLPPDVATATLAVDGVRVSSGATLQFDGATVESGGRLYLKDNTLTDGVTVSSGGLVEGSGTLLGATFAAGELEELTLGDASGDPADASVTSGGIARYVQVLNATLTASSGATAEYMTVSAGGVLAVSAGGRGVVVQVVSGGTLQATSGAALESATVSSGATLALAFETLASGATATAGTIAASTTSGGATVLAGGVVDQADLTVLSGGVLDLGAGGVAESLVVNAGGLVSGPGEIVGDTLVSGAVSGATLDGTLTDAGRAVRLNLAPDAVLQVQAGGLAIYDVASSGAQVVVRSGGVASGGTVLVRASLTVQSGGAADATTVSSGGSQFISSGGADSGSVIKAGGSETLAYSATAENVTVSSGGSVDFQDAIVFSGQTAVLTAAGSAASIDGVSALAGATLDVQSAAVRSGATLSLAAGAVQANLQVEVGGTVLGPGDLGGDTTPYVEGASVPESLSNDYGLVSGATVGLSGGQALFIIHSGGVAENLGVYQSLDVFSGGQLSGATLDAGDAIVAVSAGGVASQVVIEQGEAQIGGLASGLSVMGGSLIGVYEGGVATGVSVLSNAELWVSAGGQASGVSVSSGGVLQLDLEGAVSGATVSSGATLILDDDDATIQSGRTLSVGALASATTVDGAAVSSGVRENAAYLNVASGAKVSFGSGGALGYVDVEAGALVSGPGAIYGVVSIYGTVSNVTAETDPNVNLLPYLYEEPPLLMFGGIEQVIESGGAAVGLTVASGGDVELLSGGSANGFTVTSSGILDVSGQAVSGQVQSGGVLYDESGATLSATTVAAGGTLFEDNAYTVSAGAKATEGVQITSTSVDGVGVSSGGLVEYEDATVLSGGVMSFNDSAVSYLDDGDELTISAGGVASGSGVFNGIIYDAGTVSGLMLGNPETLADNGGNEGQLSVESGGSALSVTVLTGAYLEVDSGGSATHTTVYGGKTGALDYGREVIDSGASVSGGAVLSNGSAVISSGASVSDLVVSSGGQVMLGLGVSSGQDLVVSTSLPLATTTLDGVTLDSGALLTLSGVTVFSGGELQLGSGGRVDALTISHGGIVSGGELATFATFTDEDYGISSTDYGLLEDVELGQYTLIGSGGVGSDLTLLTNELEIQSGGRVDGLQVFAGPDTAVQVDGGGVLSGAVLEAQPGQSYAQIDIYGSAADDVIGSGITEVAAGVDTGALVQYGGTLQVGYGGTVSGATVLSGGIYIDYPYAGEATTEAVTVSSGGRDEADTYEYVVSGQTLSDGAVAATTQIGGVTLLKGAFADYGGTVESGGVLSVGAGARAEAVTVYQGGVVRGPGVLAAGGTNSGSISGVTLSGELFDSAVTSAIEIAAGGVDFLAAGATARADTVQAGGEQVVTAGGLITSGHVLSAGDIVLLGGGAASKTVVSGGGSATVQAVVSSGVTQSFALPTSTASSVFGGLTLDPGATAALQSATVLAGGRLILGAGVDVVNGGEYLNNGFETTLFNAGVTVSSGGLVSGTGGVGGLLTVSSGGEAEGVSVLDGGMDLVASGGRQVGVLVLSGASLEAIGLTVSSAVAVGVITAAETLDGATVSSGAQASISGGSIVSGGSLRVLAGGSAQDVATLAGGVLIDGGTVSFDQAGTVTLAGALSGGGAVQAVGTATTLVVSGGGSTFSGQIQIGRPYPYAYDTTNAVEIAAAGALGSGAVTFNGLASDSLSATLQIDAADIPASGATLANTLNDFADSADGLDLRGLAYSAGATATLSGSTLTLTDGGRTAKFTLAGQTAASYTVASDGHGGTMIAPTAAAAAALVQAAAAFDPAASPSAQPSEVHSAPAAPHAWMSTPHGEAQSALQMRPALA